MPVYDIFMTHVLKIISKQILRTAFSKIAKNKRFYMDKKLEVGDVIMLKKGHPCGTNSWEILRTGMDFKLKCTGCERIVMLPRKQVENSFRGYSEK